MGLGCLAGLAGLEIGVRAFWRPELASWQRNLDAVFPLDPAVTIGVAGPARIRTNSRGLRGPEMAADRAGEYRILALGGSTTECLAQDQPNTWPARLQALLPDAPGRRRVWVGNAGHGGHLIPHHVLAMKHMPAQYDPDAIVILAGGNDPVRALNEGFARGPNSSGRERDPRELAADFSECPAPLAVSGGLLSPRRLRLTAYLRAFRKRFSGGGFGQTAVRYREMQERRRHPSRIVDAMPDLGPGLDGYRRDIREIIRLARTGRRHLVFMTQPSLFKPEMPPEELNRLWAGWRGDPGLNAYWSPRVLAAAGEAFNRALLETCREEGVDCLDLASDLPKTTAITWDQAHFTDLGSRLTAEKLAEHFQAHFLRTASRRGAS
jgi:lysophospholipase L1-like esterase